MVSDSRHTLSMIMVMDSNRLIGANGGLPWHLPSELQYFKSVTMGKPMIMGRKTWESIGRPLPGRTSIVVTSDSNYEAKGALVVDSLELAITTSLEYMDESAEIMIIGGAALCRAAMPITDKLYLTVLEDTFVGDTWLDSFEYESWKELSRNDVVVDGYRLSYLVMSRRYS